MQGEAAGTAAVGGGLVKASGSMGWSVRAWVCRMETLTPLRTDKGDPAGGEDADWESSVTLGGMCLRKRGVPGT